MFKLLVYFGLLCLVTIVSGASLRQRTRRLNQDKLNDIPTGEVFWKKLHSITVHRIKRTAHAEPPGHSNEVSKEVPTERHAPDHHISALLDHILDQVKKGHVTAEEYAHWKTEINSALYEGTLSAEEYHHFIDSLQALTSSGGSHQADTFWFG